MNVLDNIEHMDTRCTVLETWIRGCNVGLGGDTDPQAYARNAFKLPLNDGSIGTAISNRGVTGALNMRTRMHQRFIMFPLSLRNSLGAERGYSNFNDMISSVLLAFGNASNIY